MLKTIVTKNSWASLAKRDTCNSLHDYLQKCKLAEFTLLLEKKTLSRTSFNS